VEESKSGKVLGRPDTPVAIAGLTRALALTSQRITVNAIVRGGLRQKWRSRHARGRGRDRSDVPAAAAITGQTCNICGGQTMDQGCERAAIIGGSCTLISALDQPVQTKSLQDPGFLASENAPGIH